MSNRRELAAALISGNAALLRCPVCSGGMKVADQKSLVCVHNHCFDLSKHGYINLLNHSAGTKYGKDLFRSRKIISETGFFEPLLVRISDKIGKPAIPGKDRIAILDAGCGEGSLLSGIREKLNPESMKDYVTVGLDISKEGIQLASRRKPGILWCVADLANIPFADKQFDYVLNLLSPANYSEFTRVMSEEGLLIKAVPGENYLRELRIKGYGGKNRPAYTNDRTVARFKHNFQLNETERLQYRVSLDSRLIEALLEMTPLSWGADKEAMRTVVKNDLVEITIDLTILYGWRLS